MGHKRSAETAGLGHAAGMYSLSTTTEQGGEEDVWRAMESAVGDMYRDESAYAALPLTTAVGGPPQQLPPPAFTTDRGSCGPGATASPPPAPPAPPG